MKARRNWCETEIKWASRNGRYRLNNVQIHFFFSRLPHILTYIHIFFLYIIHCGLFIVVSVEIDDGRFKSRQVKNTSIFAARVRVEIIIKKVNKYNENNDQNISMPTSLCSVKTVWQLHINLNHEIFIFINFQQWRSQ